MLPKYPIDTVSCFYFAYFMRKITFYKSVIFYFTHPCFNLLSRADYIT